MKLKAFHVTQNETPKSKQMSVYTNKLSQNFVECAKWWSHLSWFFYIDEQNFKRGRVKGDKKKLQKVQAQKKA